MDIVPKNILNVYRVRNHTSTSGILLVRVSSYHLPWPASSYTWSTTKRTPSKFLDQELINSSFLAFLNIAIASVVAISSIVVLEGSQLTDNPSHCSAMLHKRSSTNKS
jgi:hypothetical protein